MKRNQEDLKNFNNRNYRKESYYWLIDIAL